MKRLTIFVAVVAALAGIVTITLPAPGQADGEAVAPFVTEIPDGYRDWSWISSAHEAGSLNSLGAVLGKDGAIIAALHYHYVASDENNKVFGQAQSFVPGAPSNVQFMVKDSKKYAATGGWGFGHFQDGKHGDAVFMKSCFPCHEKAKGSDLVFTHYAP